MSFGKAAFLAKVAREIPLNIQRRPETTTETPTGPTVIEAAKTKRDWRAACLEWQREHGKPIPAPPEEAPIRSDVCSLGDIKRVICSHFGILETELDSHRHERRVSLPRQIFYYFAKKLTTKSFPQIGRMIGDRDHSTIIYGARKITRLLESDDDLWREVSTIENHLRDGTMPEMSVPEYTAPTIRGKWSKDDLEIAFSLARKGAKLKKIANIMNRTQGSVIGALRRSGTNVRELRNPPACPPDTPTGDA